MILVLTCLVAGSSPLTRGKLETPHQGLAARGLIPTHAGNTSGRSFRPSSGGAPPRSRRETRISVTRRRIIRAHPRSRGENTVVSLEQLAPAGSSPLTQGKRQQDRHRQAAPRLIPAHTGKTRCGPTFARTRRAHPHSRRENPLTCFFGVPCRGSSPLTRGKPLVGLAALERPGPIPTHAGKTAAHSIPAPIRTAHPRSCGENAGTTQRLPPLSGSSPLTRGKL